MSESDRVTVATWNVNSIRVRLERLLSFLNEVAPDVCLLQETKVVDSDFPRDDIVAAGYRVETFGQPTYNGVAILSRDDLNDVVRGFGDGDDDGGARLIGATTHGMRVYSVYVPNGKKTGTEHYEFKLRWLERLREYLETREDLDGPLVLGGDFNVAPEDRDVANPEKWAPSVLCTREVRERLAAIKALGFVDCIRLHHEGPGPYSWWDYRMLAFPKNDGLRIDHVFATRALADRCVEAWVDRDRRKTSTGPEGTKPSDHAPVIASFASLPQG